MFPFCNCFAAGMLMAMAFCHILPESEMMFAEIAASKAETPIVQSLEEHHDEEGESEEGHDDDNHDAMENSEGDDQGHEQNGHDDHKGHDDHAGEGGKGFPIAFVLFTAGFMLMLVLDKVLFDSV